MLSLKTLFAAALLALSVTAESFDPSNVCGKAAVDCGNGFCCSAGTTCTTIKDVPFCGKDKDTVVAAYPFDSHALEAAQSALSEVIAEYATPTPTPTPSSSSLVAYATSSSVISSTHGYNSTSHYAHSSTSIRPTGGYTTTVHPTGGYSATGSASTSIVSFTAGASRLVGVKGAEGVMGVVGVSALMGVLGMGIMLW